MLTVKREETLRFYEQHPYLDFEEMNALLVQMLTKIFNCSQSDNIQKDLILSMLNKINDKCSTLEDNQKDIDKNFANKQKELLDSISLLLFTTKDSYVKELEKYVQSGKAEDMKFQQETANNNLEKILDKLQIYFGNEFMTSFSKQVNDYNNDLKAEFKQIVNSDVNEKNILQFQASINVKHDCILQNIEKLNNEFKSELSKVDIKDDFVCIKNHFERQKNSSNKGADGENKLELILNNLFPEGDVQNTTGKSKSGDFIVERDDAPSIMFENKDYSANVPVCEVEKFIRDIDNLNMSGIFLSQNSGISRKKDYQIDIHNNNVIIFVHDVNYSVDKIKVAVNMLEHIKAKLLQIDRHGDVVPESILLDINKEYQVFLSRRNSMLDTVRKFNKDMTSQIHDLNMPELTNLLSDKFASTSIDLNPFQCKVCGKLYRNAKSLAAHNKKCVTIEET